MGQVPSKYFLPSAPYGQSPSSVTLNPTQPAAQNPQQPLLPPNFQDPGTMASQQQQQSLTQQNPRMNPQNPTNYYRQMYGGLYQ